MITIIVDCILFLLSVSAISQMMAYTDRHKCPDMVKMRLVYIGVTYLAILLFDMFAYLAFGIKIGYIAYGARQVMTIMFISALVMGCEDIVKIPGSYVVKFITFLNYSVVFLYIIDTVITKGELKYSLFGVFMPLEKTYHQLIYMVVYSIYIMMFVAFILYGASFAVKKRDKYKVFLLGVSLGACSAGILIEYMMSIFLDSVYKISIIFNFIALISFYFLSKYNREIQILKEDYESEISPSRVDIVFVMDDELKIVFMNKRAEVMGQIYHDDYYGRRIDDIFSFTDENYNEIVNSKGRRPFGSSAEYTFANRHVNMVFEHKLDRYGELIASTVNVYNMEPKENAFNTEKPKGERLNQNVDKLREQVSEVSAGTRVLLIDENISFLNEFQKLLEPFKVKVTRAVGGSDALERVLNGEYDIIFVSDGMITMSAHDLCSRIRDFKGKYYEEIPIILVTASDMNEIYLQVLDAGFTDFLYKPISSANLGEILMSWAWKKAQK